MMSSCLCLASSRDTSCRLPPPPRLRPRLRNPSLLLLGLRAESHSDNLTAQVHLHLSSGLGVLRP